MGDDDWDLHAVVRGCRGGQAAAATRDPFSSFMAAGEGCDFSNLFENRHDVPVLEEVCRPFFNRPLVLPQRREPSPVSTSPASGAIIGGGGGAAAAVPSARHPNRRLSQNPRSKRRKNQQKRVVCEISATDAATSDMWAWRKYGQKPIKGSPYPRGYYRCSSSKGCLARKQVERSRTDPNMLIITYTAEHNHAVPTHRNSLAGSTRQKFPAGDRRTVSENISSSPPSSLTAVVSMEEGEQEEESEEGVLLVEDMEVLEEGNVLFMEGGGGLDGFGDVGFDFLGCEEQAFDWPWLGADSKGNGNAAAAAGGS